MKNKAAVLTKAGAQAQRPVQVAAMPWLRSYPPNIDTSPDFPEKPLYSLLDESADKYGERPCVEFRGRTFSYEEIKTLSDRAAKGLQDSGFKPGMKLGLFLPNCPMFVVFFFAGLKAGGTIVNYNPLYVAEEVARQIVDSGTDYMVTLDLKVLLGTFSTMFEQTSLQKIIVCSLADQLPTLTGLMFRTMKRRDIAKIPRDSRYIHVDTMLRNDGRCSTPKVNPKSDIAVLQYTGGTTGVPKGAALTHHNLYTNALQCKMWFHVADSPDSRTVGILPLFHALAMTSVMNWSLAVGASMLLEPRFEALKLLSLIHRRKPTILIGVPTLYTALMKST